MFIDYKKLGIDKKTRRKRFLEMKFYEIAMIRYLQRLLPDIVPPVIAAFNHYDKDEFNQVDRYINDFFGNSLVKN